MEKRAILNSLFFGSPRGMDIVDRYEHVREVRLMKLRLSGVQQVTTLLILKPSPGGG